MSKDRQFNRIKRWVVDYFLDPLISQRKLKSYTGFWVRCILRVRKPFVIAITGSVGKTTTKDVVATVLSHPNAQGSVGTVCCTQGNLNVDVDLLGMLLLQQDGSFVIPWSYFDRFVFLFKLPLNAMRAAFGDYPQVWVLECGVCAISDLEWQAHLLQPNVAVVTRIGAAHLEKFKTIQGLVHEKGALVRAVAPSGLVVLGEEHEFVNDLERMSRAKVVKVGGTGIDLSKNIARAICQYMKIGDEVVEVAMKEFKGPSGRLSKVEIGGVRIIDDSFNANPLSMKLGLDQLKEVGRLSSRRLAVLGDMAELGADSRAYHEEVGGYARDRADLVIGVGSLAKFYGADYLFADSDACADAISNLICVGDCVFVKGSGSIKMGKIVEKLQEIGNKGFRREVNGFSGGNVSG